MALVSTENMAVQSKGFNALPFLKQLALLGGLAASVAIGVSVVLWSQTPEYRVLYSNLADQDVAQVAAALQQSSIKYQVNSSSGAIMVSSVQINDARMKLASQGLPKGLGSGFEMLQEGTGFGVSQFMENARFQKALEGELSRTISSLNNINSARVHLAIPKQSAFVRKQKKPTASVTIDLIPGRRLEDNQVGAITHLVSASIPNLDAESVTVIDQNGHLLSTSGDSSDMALTSTQFDYRRKLESYYIQRIENIIEPIVGEGGVRAQVSASVDFTVTEQTHESYNPDMPAIRSEQTVEEQLMGSRAATGVPGSLSNQPPDTGATEENGLGAEPRSSTKRATKNYELDKTISHVRQGGGKITQLSIAVVVDNRFGPDLADETKDGKKDSDKPGQWVSTPRSVDEINRLTALVKEAVGFDVQRGDSVKVINQAFSVPQPVEPLPEPSMMENPNLWSIVKQVIAGFMVLILVFGVLKPVLRQLATRGEEETEAEAALLLAQQQTQSSELADDQLSLTNQQGGGVMADNPSMFQNNIDQAKSLTTEDPKRVAQVVNNWIAADG